MTVLLATDLEELTLPNSLTVGSYPTREHVLAVIAELYRDLVEPLNGRAGIRGDGGSLPILDPRLYTPTVREFERLARLMRNDRTHPVIHLADGRKASVRQLWWHTAEWHIRAERTRFEPKPRIVKNQPRRPIRLPVDQLDGRPLPHIRIHRHPKADEQLAAAGIAWMAAHWGLPTEPMLPAAIHTA